MRDSAQELRPGLLRSVLDNESLGVAVFRPMDAGRDFVTLYVNAAFQALKPAVPMIGRRFSTVWPETADVFIPEMRRVFETGTPWMAEDRAVELEREPGTKTTGYFTFRVTRVEIGDGLGLLSEVRESTDEVRAEREALRELEVTRALLQASRALSEAVDLQHVLNTLAEVLLSSTSHTRSFAFSWDAGRRILTRAASAGEEAFPVGQEFKFDEVSEITQGVIREQRSAVVDFDALPPEKRGSALAKQRSHILVVVPMSWHGRLVGLIGVDDPGTRREFPTREIEIIEGIAAQAATAIENARLFEEREGALLSLARKDRDIRQAYSDVIDAVTGGRLVLLGTDEIGQVLCDVHGPEYEIPAPPALADARGVLRRELAGMPGLEDVILAFSEGATNMLKYAGGGRYRICRDARRLQLVLSDSGPGIDFRNLPKATLVPGFSTTQTLGMGFSLMMDLTDRLLLATGSDGTTLVLEKELVSG